VLDQTPPPDSGWQLAFAGEPFSLWQMPAHSPAVAAPGVTALAALPSAAFPDLVEGMRIDPVANSAARIPVLAAPEEAEAAPAGPLRLTVRDYRVDLKSVRLDYELNEPGYLQLSYSAYPYLHLYLDGQRVDYFSTAFYLIGLHSPAGRHTIELRPVLSTLRLLCYWLDGVGLLAIALLLILGKHPPGWRHPRPSGPGFGQEG
jgi:hypothetical protein